MYCLTIESRFVFPQRVSLHLPRLETFERHTSSRKRKILKLNRKSETASYRFSEMESQFHFRKHQKSHEEYFRFERRFAKPISFERHKENRNRSYGVSFIFTSLRVVQIYSTK